MAVYTLKQKVKNFAIFTRVSVLLLQALSNLLIPDHHADAFISPENPELPVLWGDKVIEFLLGGLVRWDAQYFLHIAEYGYTHENTLAFFPVFPMLVRLIGNILHFPLQYVMNYHSVLILSSVILNFYMFVKTASILHRLSEEVLKSEVLAYKAAILFCINPATVFFTAPYSECLFAFFTFSALLVNQSQSTTRSAFPFALASSVRSNGLVNIGFILYRKLLDCNNYYHKIRNATTESGQLSLLLVVVLTFNYTLIPLFVGCFLVMLPFAIFQMWCYLTYCGEEGSSPSLAPHLEMFVRSNFLHSPDLGEAEWCYNYPPLAYSHVQDKYWEVGLLRYYEVRQVPNFMLALPVVMIVICHAALYMVDNPQICWSFGIPQPSVDGKGNKKKPHSWPDKGINSWRVFVYTAHSLGLCAFCVLCIHVQVTTRLLCSSCPVIYWFAAHLLTDQTKKEGKDERQCVEIRAEAVENMNSFYKVALLSEFPKSFWGQVILSYFLLYCFVGVILYSNFLPWT
ncbi:GPI mannosyltransferase 2 isoform X1 [Macrobrachium rosenbergii]|uniref:GPI mannosyltransferase 2 isoform X1 n=1 Tax=Macrobrachium rosenbergii TaxID=79674 RepID=UPI0034D78A4A